MGVPLLGGISTGAGDPEGGPSAVRLQISLRRPRGYLSLLFRRCFPLPAGFRCWCGRWPLSGRWRGKSRRGPPGGAADQDRDVVVDGPAGVTGDGAEQRVQCARGWAPRPGAPGRPGRRARGYGRVSPSARRCRAAASPGRPSPDEYRRDKVLLGCSRLVDEPGCRARDVDRTIAAVSRRLLNQSTPGLPERGDPHRGELSWATPRGGSMVSVLGTSQLGSGRPLPAASREWTAHRRALRVICTRPP